MNNPIARIDEELNRLKAASLYRSMKTLNSEQGTTVLLEKEEEGTVSDVPRLLLSSNSYLNMATEPRVKQAAADAALKWGAGSGGSRLTTGNFGLHRQLEKALAKFKGREAALLFNTGYTANVGIISALMDESSLIFSDEYNHASIIDGCRLSRAKIIVYRHNDMASLEEKLKANPTEKGLIVSDAVFSMDRDIVNLPEMVALGRKYGCLTMIDEAHATGVIGSKGHGTEEYFIDKGYKKEDVMLDILMGTLSKALGAEGGFAAASQNIIDYLVNKARSFIFSTSQAPATLAAALEALNIVEAEPQHVASLQHNVEVFCNALTENGVPTKSETPIIPIVIGDEAKAMQVAAAVEEAGIMVPAIRYPTVAKGTARLRVALMADHTEEELTRAAKVIAEAMK